MALFNCNYSSSLMNKYMAMNVILPNEDAQAIKDKEGKFAVIYLLHGYTDDYTKWQRLTSIERYANDMGIAVVMPEAGKSFYTDMAYGDPYFSYITEDVPAHVQKWFPITSDPEYTSIAGISMGGYGAMKIALTYPDRYKSAATFSGALAMAQLLQTKIEDDVEEWLKRLTKDLPLIFGENVDITGTKDDVFWLASQLKASGKTIPKLYLSCGTDDFIYEETVAFKNYLEFLNIPFDYSERPGGHEWKLWDDEVKKFIEMICNWYF
ncbi:alpha/beta hydrolase [Clostridium sp. DL1XJH146]